VEFKSNDLKMFINTLCYDNVENYDFKDCDYFIEDVLKLNVLFIV
jgi:hypothetical protein